MKIEACAKINRNLFVVGTRPDGYHELKTVFQSLALHDTLEFEPAAHGLAIECDTPGIPVDERNLVWKAARLVWTEAGRAGEPTGRVRLAKRIPAQGGLGGGSADGAAALVGWNQIWEAGLSSERLMNLAARLGADVPFFLVGGTALGLERGDEIYPLEDRPRREVVLVFPPFGVSTPEAFRWYDEDRAAGHAAISPDGRVFDCVNELEGPVARRHPELAGIRAILEASGAEAAAMTGSGSTVFGLFADPGGAKAAAAAIEAAGWQAVVTRTATRREARLGRPRRLV